MTDNPLYTLAEEKGILPVFHDLGGQAHWTGDDTRRALLRAIGVAAETEAEARKSLEAHWAEKAREIAPPEYVVTAGQGAAIPVKRACDWILLSEDQTAICDGRAEHHIDLPPLEAGVYTMRVSCGDLVQTCLVPAAPAQVPTLPTCMGQERVWGVTAALYGLRSKRNLGIGDYADLGVLAKTLGDAGASFLGINPVHNWGWESPAIASPYSPSHRGFLNTIHIAPDAIPGLENTADAQALVARLQSKIDRTTAQVDYAGHAKRQAPLLRELFALFNVAASGPAKERLATFTHSGGEELRSFAIFEALSETHGSSWLDWPAHLQDHTTIPSGSYNPNALAFHIWLQWIAFEQLQMVTSASAMPLGLYLDLAVGARRDGAEAWMGQESVAKGVALGAPPDHLSPEGQNWQLTAFAHGLSSANQYHDFRSVLRHAMQPAGVLRIDHVLGLNRSFWIPDDGSPGAYIRQPFETLLALTAIEAQKANCIVVGEDLGLVPDGFRETLAHRGLYSYSVLQYEKDGNGTFRDPAQLRQQSLACFATHDTPTLQGYCAGRDIEWWQKLGWIDQPKADWLSGERKAEVAALVPAGEASDQAIHGRLAQSPVAMAAVQLDDVLGEVEAQNLPGTIDEHPNWSRIYDVAVEDLAQTPALTHLTDLMRDAGRAACNFEGNT